MVSDLGFKDPSLASGAYKLCLQNWQEALLGIFPSSFLIQVIFSKTWWTGGLQEKEMPQHSYPGLTKKESLRLS